MGHPCSAKDSSASWAVLWSAWLVRTRTKVALRMAVVAQVWRTFVRAGGVNQYDAVDSGIQHRAATVPHPEVNLQATGGNHTCEMPLPMVR
jgi:hypothetical protein